MKIKMNLAAKASENNTCFDLFNTVKTEAYVMEKEENTETINNLVIDCQKDYTNDKFENLLKLVYRTYNIHLKVIDTAAASNRSFLADEDYFQLYSQVLWSCIRNYDPEISNFKNYFIKQFRVTFMQEKKCSYMRVTGYIEPEKRENKRILFFNDIDTSLGNMSTEIVSLENEDLIERILSCLNDSEKEYITHAYFSSANGKPLKSKQVAEDLGIPVGRVKYLRRRAFDKIRNKYPNALNELMLGKGNNIIMFSSNKAEIDVNKTLENAQAS